MAERRMSLPKERLGELAERTRRVAGGDPVIAAISQVFRAAELVAKVKIGLPDGSSLGGVELLAQALRINAEVAKSHGYAEDSLIGEDEFRRYRETEVFLKYLAEAGEIASGRRDIRAGITLPGGVLPLEG